MARGSRSLVKLVSTAGTGFIYYTNKNKRTTPDRLELHKYDPKVRTHVLFRESK
jgi:large subunit ribosomal protein L33